MTLELTLAIIATSTILLNLLGAILGIKLYSMRLKDSNNAKIENKKASKTITKKKRNSWKH
jgi:ABC-type methionine transport system permease subunit